MCLLRKNFSLTHSKQAQLLNKNILQSFQNMQMQLVIQPKLSFTKMFSKTFFGKYSTTTDKITHAKLNYRISQSSNASTIIQTYRG